jgi:hypothetical protein
MQPTATTPNRPSFPQLWQASKSGDLARVVSLLESESPHSSEELSRFLAAAAKGGHVAVARCLLERGASIKAAPLDAVKAKSTDLLLLFMEFGWRVNDPVWCGHVVLPCVISLFCCFGRVQQHLAPLQMTSRPAMPVFPKTITIAK